MKRNLSPLVTLNLFQGPSPVEAVSATFVASNGPWMLKQVQHDEFKANMNA